MPIHDWTRVDAGLFHSFHQRWIGALCDAFNMGGLPHDFFALAEQSIRGPVPDVLTLRLSPKGGPSNGPTKAVDIAVSPPRARVVRQAEAGVYLRKVNRVAVRHWHGEIVAVVEIVSPGNKGSVSELRAFVDKTSDLIQRGIHVLVIDLFPPTKRDPQGLHKEIWDQIEADDFTLPAGTPLTIASYSAGPIKTAYVEPIAVGDVLPEMPLFLTPDSYVPAPLEATYRTTWGVFPAALKGLLEPSDAEDDRSRT